ncbi:MAG TPA: hypothetical protein VMM76_27005 [Pirellulaceae bacterium]|nr:hypothetical protein [Pirellulaceae bacterium]
MSSQPPSPNPFAEDSSDSTDDPAEGKPNTPMSGHEAYNLVSDLVVGGNLRKSDNVFQLKVILICTIVGVSLGAIAGAILSGSGHRLVGALAAGLGLGFAGVVVGLFGSGIYLMIYRAVCHMKGQHD